MPVALAGYFLLGRVARVAAMGWLLAASLVFYAWWEPIYLALLVPSIAFNYIMGRLVYAGGSRHVTAKGTLIFAIAVNLIVLAFFKYADFLAGSFNFLFGLKMQLPGIVLPIGISFFTFTQIAFLVDCYKRDASEFNPVYYGLFVTYYPHLIAGPILHHKEMMPQFASADALSPKVDRFIEGGALFLIGLAKKVILADGVAQFVAPVFSGNGVIPLSPAEAWGGALAYTLQLYFDFSAYSDMAVGLSRMIGIELPLNFNSPYKATSITDFWRRWHMTLSRFLRDYLYIPLGGNRKGAPRRYINLMLTMLLGGLWHGANWTFVLWGGLHGLYLGLNHLWRDTIGKRITIPGWLGWLLTFLAVVVAWVVFRADSLGQALKILGSMTGFGIPAAGTFWSVPEGTAQVIDLTRCYGWIVSLLAFAVFFPNSTELSQRISARALSTNISFDMRVTVLGAGFSASLFLILIGETRGVSEFLYFNF